MLKEKGGLDCVSFLFETRTEEITNNEFWYIEKWMCNFQTNLMKINGQGIMNPVTENNLELEVCEENRQTI